MTRRRVLAALAPLVPLAALLAGCGERPLEGPPEIRLGRDACDHCGMMIAEDRCSAASIVVRDGERTALRFDDIGCLLDWERGDAGENEPREVVARFVHDHETRAWIEAPNATFLMSEAFHTPMGSWIVAFTDGPAAAAARQRDGGTVFSWPELADARVRWLARQGRMVEP